MRRGGVEGEGGRFRRTHLVAVPRVNSLAELNKRLAAFDDDDDARRIANRARTVGDLVAQDVRDDVTDLPAVPQPRRLPLLRGQRAI